MRLRVRDNPSVSLSADSSPCTGEPLRGAPAARIEKRCGGTPSVSFADSFPRGEAEALRRGLKRENDGAAYIIYTRARVFSPLGKILSLGPFSDKGKKRWGAA